MSDDITFCYNQNCKHLECARHPSNIKDYYIPHSFGFFEDCEYWDLPKRVFTVSDKENKG